MMEFNDAVLTAIVAFSVGLSLVVQAPFVKSVIKAIARKLYDGKFSQRFIPDDLDADTFAKQCVVFVVWVMACGLVVITHNVDMEVLVNNMSAEWRWLASVKALSVSGLANIVWEDYTLAWYLDKLALTVMVSLSSQTIYAIGKAAKEVIPLASLVLKLKVVQIENHETA